MRLIPYSKASVYESLALEEAIFQIGKENPEIFEDTIRFTSFKKPSVILAKNQALREIDWEYCEFNNIDVAMRKSGGGSVFFGKGDIYFSMITQNRDPHEEIHQNIAAGLQNLGYDAFLTLNNGYKIVRLGGRGIFFDARLKSKNWIMHHGAILVNPEDYHHMPISLKATKEEKKVLREGNDWLYSHQVLPIEEIISSIAVQFENLHEGSYNQLELERAEKLLLKYENSNLLKQGRKHYGICYLTDSPYDLEKYTN